MYGWEFPPRISGGLGTACHAIVQELAERNIDLTLVLPQVDELPAIEHVNLIGCDNIAPPKPEIPEVVDVRYSEIAMYLSPYITGKSWQQRAQQKISRDVSVLLAGLNLPEEFKAMASRENITGKYGVNLLAEVLHYALFAGTMAKNIPHDLIHAHDWLTMLAALEARCYSHKPVVLHVHALEVDRSGLEVDKRIFAIEKYGMEQADKIIAVSQYTKDNIVKHYNIAPEKITVVHNGVYCQRATPVAANHPKMVLFLGRITQQKGPYFFLEVASKVLAKRQDVQFVLVGAGELLVEMIERTANLQLGKNIHFTGFLDSERVKEIYQLADVYVMPSVSEPFGLSALEALSYDVPAIVTRQSGVTEVLHHTLVADFWDTEDIAAKILALLAYPVLRQASLVNTKKDLQAITWSKTAEKIIAVYQQMILAKEK